MILSLSSWLNSLYSSNCNNPFISSVIYLLSSSFIVSFVCSFISSVIYWFGCCTISCFISGSIFATVSSMNPSFMLLVLGSTLVSLYIFAKSPGPVDFPKASIKCSVIGRFNDPTSLFFLGRPRFGFCFTGFPSFIVTHFFHFGFTGSSGSGFVIYCVTSGSLIYCVTSGSVIYYTASGSVVIAGSILLSL